jgi:hypothetical protein
MSKHTPGPWTADQYGGIEDARGMTVAVCVQGEQWQTADGGIDVEEFPYEANARLMAAAPELLEALKELYNASLVMEQPRFYKALAEAKKVIAKIEGDE